MNSNNRPSFRSNQEHGQASIEFIFALTISMTIFFLLIQFAGPQISQIFGDVQCGLKYGENAYMSTLYGDSYCFRATYNLDGTMRYDNSRPLGKPIISYARPPEARTVVVNEP